MKLHIFSDEIELENYPILLDEAFELLEKQSSKEKVDDNFIGFTFDNNEKAMIQFDRITDQQWRIDIPTYVQNEFHGALNSLIMHQNVFTITRDFFNLDSVLYKSISENDYTKVVSHFKSAYGIVLELESL